MNSSPFRWPKKVRDARVATEATAATEATERVTETAAIAITVLADAKAANAQVASHRQPATKPTVQRVIGVQQPTGVRGLKAAGRNGPRANARPHPRRLVPSACVLVERTARLR